MVLELLQSEINNYKRIKTSASYDEVYKWEALKNYKDNWDIDVEDFLTMYTNSFSCESGENLWASRFFYPKQCMIEMIELDPERCRTMFKELFDESKDVEERIDRFVWHCDELRAERNKENPQFKNHYHDGFRMISTYLAFEYPEKYSIYKYTEFKNFMTKVKAKSIPRTNEISRFFTVMRTLNKFVAKDSDLQKLHKSQIQAPEYYQQDTLLSAQDLYWCCSGRYDGRG